MYYIYVTKNKGADQMRSYCAAQLILAFIFAYKKGRFFHETAQRWIKNLEQSVFLQRGMRRENLTVRHYVNLVIIEGGFSCVSPP